MKRNHLNRFTGHLTTIATLLALSSASQGADLYWDNNGNTLGFGNPTGGAWNGTNAFWNKSSTGEGVIGDLTATTAAADNLFFPGNGASGSVINLSFSQSAASLTFNNPSPGYMPLQISNGASLTLSGAITDTGTGSADIRVLNQNAATAATTLVASSISIGVIDFGGSASANNYFWTTGYNITAFTQFGMGNQSGNSTFTQTGGIIKVNDTQRGFAMGAAVTGVPTAGKKTTYVMDGGTLQVDRIGVGSGTDGNNNTANSQGDRYIVDGVMQFNNGEVRNLATNSTMVFQNGYGFNAYNGTGTKDMQYNTSKPLQVELAQTGTHTLTVDGASGTMIVAPSAQFVNKTGENGTLTKTGLGSLIFTGGGPVAVNSYTGSTTVTAGTVSADYRRIAGQAATGGMDNLSNAYSAASSLVLNGGNFSLVGRGSATDSSANVTLNTGSAGLQVNVGSTTSLVVGQSVTNANLPAGTHIRRILNATTIELSAMSTSTTSQTDQTLDFGAATFANTQTVSSVDLQQAGNGTTVTVTPGAGTSTTLLSFGDVSSSATGGFTKAGAGTLQLTGTVSYTGPTAINAGNLDFASSTDQTITAAITGTASGTLVKSGAGILTIDSAPAGANTFSGAVIVNGGTLSNASSGKGLMFASSFTVNNGGILLAPSSSLGFGAMGALTVNAGGIFRGGFQNLGSVTLNGGTIDGTGGFGGNSFALGSDVTVGGSSPSIIQGTQRLALNIAPGTIGDTRTFNVDDVTGDANADLTISCVVHNAHVANGTVTGGTLTNLAKTGAGTLLLSGVNTYTGDTTVLDGTLAVNGTSINNATKLIIDGGKVDLTGAETVNTYFIGAVQQAAGTYSANGITLTGSGTLIVTTGPSASNYGAWQSANSTAQTADLDHDNDGVSNGVEHFLGGTANTTGNSHPLPGVTSTAGVLSVTWVRNAGFAGFPGNYGSGFVVETSATLANPWTAAAQGVGAGFVEITGNNVKYTFPAGTRNFARLKVMP